MINESCVGTCTLDAAVCQHKDLGKSRRHTVARSCLFGLKLQAHYGCLAHLINKSLALAVPCLREDFEGSTPALHTDREIIVIVDLPRVSQSQQMTWELRQL